ncbi:MAG TPA: TetR family transcriptional regulator [Porphyromonadaceae bacterium]|nr:TetR family transcriptional regulator [Porphyromonadaceae bacterium]
MNHKENSDSGLSTEQRIKNAARKVFHEKGFAATRTRDIAEEAGMNLALLNYYFRSKQKLFDIIMFETLQDFLKIIATVINDPETSLEQKISTFASSYIDQLLQEPQVAFFVLNELRNNQKESVLSSLIKNAISDTVFIKQYQQAVAEGKIASVSLLHFLINTVSLTIFPFLGASILKNIGEINEREFKSLMIERKELIPIWVKAMFEAK